MMISRIDHPELANTVQAFAAYLTSKGRKQSTIRRYVYDVEDYFTWLERNKKVSSNNIWSSLRTKDYENYFFELKHERHYSDKTLHRVFIVLNRLYQFLQLTYTDIVNPLKDMEMIIQPDRGLHDDDFITAEEEERLKKILVSFEGLTEKQLPARPLLIDRNVCIIMLLLDYGLSLQELVCLNMHHVHFENNTLMIPHVSGVARTITLKEEDKKKLYTYYKTIPEPVRPKYHTADPLFVAFDFNRNTYRWVYENDAPKALTEIAVQKMIRQEVARAGLRKGLSGQHLRNTFILRLIQQGISEQEIMRRVGFKTKLSLKRYYDYAKKKKS
jgi:site-specific recombinase XerD